MLEDVQSIDQGPVEVSYLDIFYNSPQNVHGYV